MSTTNSSALYYELNEYNIAYNEKVNPMKSFVLRPYGTAYILVEIFDDGHEQAAERTCFSADAAGMKKLLRIMTNKLYDED